MSNSVANQRWKWGIVAVVILAAAWVGWKYPLNLGLDLQGGTRLILEAQDSPQTKVDNDAVEGTLAVIRNRIDGLGVSEPIIRRKGTRQIIVELPGIKNPEHAIAIIGDTALLEFIGAEWAPQEALSTENVALLAGEEARIAYFEEKDSQGKVNHKRPIFLKKTLLTGADLKLATPATDQYGKPAVAIEFTDTGAIKFRDATATLVGKPLAIVLDGKLISAPNVNEPIAGGKAQITGRFTVQEMRDLVIQLKAGSLPVPVKIVSKTIVGPTLGRDSIEKSKMAGLIGCLLVSLFMIAYYGWGGVVACVALILYMALCISSLKLFHATLTLTGIAGFILSIGVALDANIIIFERIKEELRGGKAVNDALVTGFSRAFVTVLDANLTTLMAAAVLFWLGTGTVRGFALTLSIGVLVSLFSAAIVTRLLLDWLKTRISSPETKLFRLGKR